MTNCEQCDILRKRLEMTTNELITARKLIRLIRDTAQAISIYRTDDATAKIILALFGGR